MKKLVIVGAGGFAREVLWLVQEMNKASENPVQLMGFIGESEGDHLGGIPVLGNDNWAFQQLDRDVRFVVAIGSGEIRRKTAIRYLEQGFRAFHLVHPGVYMGDDVTLGQGSIICAGAVLTTNVQIGDFTIVNINATVGHDAVLGHFVTVHPGANISGGVRLADNVELGSGSVLLPEVVAGEGAVLGAGGVALGPLEAGKHYAGVPAREISAGG
jgi:sugar O-acyltransferase (sialic acid O-acetyltransferase NeuD family)